MNKTYADTSSCLSALFADESLFSISNGILGMRGSIAEGVPKGTKSHPGLYRNGIYTTYEYRYGEKGYGYPDVGQVIVNLPRADCLQLRVSGVPVNAEHHSIKHCSRSLDPTTGIVSRKTIYGTKDGFEFTIVDRRIAPENHPQVLMQEYRVTTSNYSGDVELVSGIDPTISNLFDEKDPRVLDVSGTFYDIIDINQRHLHVRSVKTNQNVHMSYKHSDSFVQQVEHGKMVGRKTYRLSPEEGISTTKYIVVTSDLDHNNPHNANRDILAGMTNQTVDSVALKRVSPVQIKDDNGVNDIVQYNLFQLERSGGDDPYHGIPAKGLSGEGYEGHYFWDTEMYMFPYFLFTAPDKAKNLLLFRYHGLKDAKDEARKLGHSQGAKYPWRTINGTEASPYYPAGTAQYHINGIIAYQFIQYHLVTNDVDFLIQHGFDVLYETALVYLDIGHFYNGSFVIHDVTGPDEYTALVNNNYYTNSMAKYHMEQTVRLFEQHQDVLNKRFDLHIIDQFRQASAKMYLLFDKEKNIHPQDDSFLSKKRIDMSAWKRPLLLHYHPLTIYRHQVCKQADVIASYMLLDNVPLDVMRDSLNYYEQVTTHDSSLSKCIFSIMHTYVGQMDTGDRYFQEQLAIDIDDTHGNTGHGLHLANLGGTYLAILYGFLGFRVHENGLSIRPRLPQYMKTVSVNLAYQGKSVIIEITSNKIIIKTSGNITMDVDGITYLIHDQTTIKRS